MKSTMAGTIRAKMARQLVRWAARIDHRPGTKYMIEHTSPTKWPTQPLNCRCDYLPVEAGLRPRIGEEVEAASGNPPWAHLLPGMRKRDR